MSETISFRVLDEIVTKINEKVHRRGYSDPSSFPIDLVVQTAGADDDEISVACAPHAYELDLGYDNKCAVLSFVARRRCNECPFREHLRKGSDE